MAPVGAGDRRRRREQVDLCHHAHHGGATAEGGSEIGDLGGRQFLAAVGDEQGAVGVIEGGEVQGPGRRLQPTDTRRVDDGQARREHSAGERHVDPPNTEVVVGVAFLAAGESQAVEVAGRRAAVSTGDGDRERVAVGAEDRGDGRVDRIGGADVGVDDGVDQARFALLELTDDGDRDPGPADAIAARPEASGEVGAPRTLGDLDHRSERSVGVGVGDTNLWLGRGETDWRRQSRSRRRHGHAGWGEQRPAHGADARRVAVARSAVRTDLHPAVTSTPPSRPDSTGCAGGRHVRSDRRTSPSPPRRNPLRTVRKHGRNTWSLRSPQPHAPCGATTERDHAWMLGAWRGCSRQRRWCCS